MESAPNSNNGILSLNCNRCWFKHISTLHLIYMFLISLLTQLAPVTGDILVVNLETNQSSPVFQDLTAAFGPRVPHHGVPGRIVYASPADACAPVQPPPGLREDDIGWILVITRGGKCQFADKVLAAQQRGYDAAIIHNYEGRESLVKMDGNQNGSFVNIPSTFVGWEEGMRLKNEYNFSYKKYYVRILEDDELNYKLYLWPFAIVVAVCFVLVMVFVIVKFVREHASRRLNRLSRKHLKKIPVRKFKKGDYYDTCAICLDEYEEGEKIRVLPCDHVYHTKCIDPWLTKNKKTCPVCKRRVMPGRDADDEGDSDMDDGNVASTENTPLLRENNSSGSGSSGGRVVPHYSTPSLNSSGNGEGTSPNSLSCSQQSASAFISTDGHGQVFLSQPSRGRARVDPVPTDLDGAQGAVGGAGISDQFGPILDGENEPLSPQQSRDTTRSKRRNRDRRRLGILDDDDRQEGLAQATEQRVAETREERRERRRKKKEKKRWAEEVARRTTATASEENSSSSWLRNEVVPTEVFADASVLNSSGVAAAHQASRGDMGSEHNDENNENERIRNKQAEDENKEPEDYINPSYSESEEIVLQNPSRRHEMNDMV
ncbi:E3 ubiquitin-protein ligase rnf13 [Plakobranchus ocellatus]|uniref:RING-type E3 ubiquitin transferase n=1 Tax=Plakobranchus ocellatus TaxID=259542 RepID=A0AAV4CVF3_9GAST|nr:E3 ubiquitin-protein ligase rnf13 [Plakobranchus ocellatus]